MRAIVTLLAHERRPGKQQRRNVGTVRRMAIRTAFYRGTMLEQEGAALLCMAHPAGFVDGVFHQQFGAGRTVGIVAIGTDDLACSDRVRRNLVAVRALLLMASEANLCLGLFIPNLVGRLVKLVAVGTTDTINLVLTAVPIHALPSLVAGKADPACGLGRRGFRTRDGVDNPANPPAAARLNVLGAIAMADSAAAIAGRSAGIPLGAMTMGLETIALGLVTALADFRTWTTSRLCHRQSGAEHEPSCQGYSRQHSKQSATGFICHLSSPDYCRQHQTLSSLRPHMTAAFHWNLLQLRTIVKQANRKTQRNRSAQASNSVAR